MYVNQTLLFKYSGHGHYQNSFLSCLSLGMLNTRTNHYRLYCSISTCPAARMTHPGDRMSGIFVPYIISQHCVRTIEYKDR